MVTARYYAAVIFFLFSLVFVYRSFYSMRIPPQPKEAREEVGARSK